MSSLENKAGLAPHNHELLELSPIDLKISFAKTSPAHNLSTGKEELGHPQKRDGSEASLLNICSSLTSLKKGGRLECPSGRILFISIFLCAPFILFVFMVFSYYVLSLD